MRLYGLMGGMYNGGHWVSLNTYSHIIQQPLQHFVFLASSFLSDFLDLHSFIFNNLFPCRVQHPRRFSKCSISDYRNYLLRGGASCLFNKPNKVGLFFYWTHYKYWYFTLVHKQWTFMLAALRGYRMWEWLCGSGRGVWLWSQNGKHLQTYISTK